jgi:Ca-activated chloride channel homolog
MKAVKSRVPIIAIAAMAFVFLPSVSIFGSRISPAASADDQQKDKPKLQKPSQPGKDPGEEPTQDRDEPVVKLGTALVLLDVTVVDPSNKPVLDLAKDSFQVTEDKVTQKIEFFSREQVPVSLLFCIDTSGSMRNKLDTVIKASIGIVKESKAGDEMGVIEFREVAEVLEEFTNDQADVIDTLNGLVARGQTAMLDALYLAADEANKNGKNRRKAVILVTDGLDKDSYYKFNEVVDHLREVDVQIYLIGFTSDLDRDSGLFKKSSKDKAETLLTKLAEETGGKAFFPKEISETHAIAQQISTDLRTQYAIGYYPSNTNKDGTFRSVRVQINSGARRLVARTRNGYTAPREGDARHANNK